MTQGPVPFLYNLLQHDTNECKNIHLLIFSQRCKGLFQEEDIRQDIKARLILPDPDWGPALPEIRRKFSYDIKHGFPDDDDLLSDDRAAELKAINASTEGEGDGMPAHRESQVKFSLDDEKKKEEKDEKKENGDPQA